MDAKVWHLLIHEIACVELTVTPSLVSRWINSIDAVMTLHKNSVRVLSLLSSRYHVSIALSVMSWNKYGCTCEMGNGS